MKRNINDVLFHLRFYDLWCVCVLSHCVTYPFIERVVAVIWFQGVLTLNLSLTSHMKGLLEKKYDVITM